MRECADTEIAFEAVKLTTGSASVFCIELITDLLYIGGLLEGDPYQYRINRPGTVNVNNWSLTMPISLEELIKDPLCGKIKSALIDSGRF